jgi:hypothetical protein
MAWFPVGARLIKMYYVANVLCVHISTPARRLGLQFTEAAVMKLGARTKVK